MYQVTSRVDREWRSLPQRFWGAVGTRILESGALDELRYPSGSRLEENYRIQEYLLRQAYYQSETLPNGLPIEWNPVPAVVGFYGANVLGYPLGVRVTDESKGSAERLPLAVETLHANSNFIALQSKIVSTAAVLGDIFLKVVERQPGEGSPSSVFIQNVSPMLVRYWDADQAGFLKGIRIDTPQLTSTFTGDERRHTLVEEWKKEGLEGGVSYYEVFPGREGSTLGDPVYSATFAELGYDFIPIVWGHCNLHWRRQLAAIDRYNFLARQVSRLNKPLAIVNSNTVDEKGRPYPPPQGIPSGMEELMTTDESLLGVVEMPGSGTLTYAGNPVDFDSYHRRMEAIREGVSDSLPEYRLSTLQGIQIAEETLRLLMNQAEQRALEMREVLEQALIRAQMMGITLSQVAGIAPEIFNIGTYEEGALDHVFKSRPVFPPTTLARAQEAQAHIANGLTVLAAYTLAGFTPQEIEVAIRLDSIPIRGQ